MFDQRVILQIGANIHNDIQWCTECLLLSMMALMTFVKLLQECWVRVLEWNVFNPELPNEFSIS